MISLIIPVRDWPAERVATCMASFSAVDPAVLDDIVVVDFGSAERVALEAPDARARVVRVEAEIWSLSEAINVGVVSARNDLVAKVDADVLLAPPGAAALAAMARDAVAARRSVLTLASAIDLPPGLGAREAWARIAAGEVLGGTMRPRWSQGLFVMFRRGDWSAIGGYDSRYTGWGNEDNDFAERMRRSGRRIAWVTEDKLPLYHVAHPSTYATVKAQAQRRKNRALMAEDNSVFRPLAFRHSRGLKLSAPAIVTHTPPHVTLAVATRARPGRDRMTAEAIAAFRGQIGNDFEVVVVDNGSTDEEFASLTRKLTGLRGVPGLRIERSPTASIPAARNLISDIARGRYICVVDDDDIALGNRLEDHLSVFTSDGLAHGSHGGWIDFDEESGQIERNSGRKRQFPALLVGGAKITAHPASLYRTDVLRAVRYDEAFLLGSDLDLALRMAALGLRVPHTGSVLTLRRFHASNVTYTGANEQALLGSRARDRLWAAISRRHAETLRQQATGQTADAFCRNQLTIEEVAALVPSYVGRWRLTLPIAALTSAADGTALDPQRLEALFETHGGGLTVLHSGVDQPVYYASDEIRGASRALKAADAMESLTGTRPGLVSSLQLQLDQGVKVDLLPLLSGAGQVMLQSQRLASAEELLAALGRINPTSLLRAAVHTVALTDDEGPGYFLISGPHASAEHVQTTRQLLAQVTELAFGYVGPSGAGNPLLKGDRVH